MGNRRIEPPLHIQKTQERIAEKLFSRITYSLGISFAELSRRTGIPAHDISRGCNGTRRFYADELVAICAYCGISMKDLIPDELWKQIEASKQAPENIRSKE